MNHQKISRNSRASVFVFIVSVIAILVAGCSGTGRTGSVANPYSGRKTAADSLKSKLASMSPGDRVKYMQEHMMEVRSTLMPAGMGAPPSASK